MDNYLKQNQVWWDEATVIHTRSDMYDLKGFQAGRNTLTPIEREELGDVSDKALLHLQCHFGMDTLSLARMGAKVTGVDFSEEAITLARSLASKLSIEANFLQSNIYELPETLDDQFDMVFTSQGVLCWLPDLAKWGQLIARTLKKSGVFYIYEGHPLLNMFEYNKDTHQLETKYSYFAGPVNEWPPGYDYADTNARMSVGTCEWTYPLSDIVKALIDAGLRIEFLHEFPVLFYPAYPLLVKDKAGWWHLEGDKLPLSFSIKATKE
jgi:SAM-dependent methyltransferase